MKGRFDYGREESDTCNVRRVYHSRLDVDVLGLRAWLLYDVNALLYIHIEAI